MGYRIEGDEFVITVDRQLTGEQAKRREELYRRALEVAKEAKP
jgi:hypothetical protein